ncbi:hypothetical protein [Nonomuraea sp. NPDC049750]|uniref:hypothetical protein n=1 Tax=Nonomuraea sp. NPDC049750 TaxID=3154738 RepID=UPI0033EE5822
MTNTNISAPHTSPSSPRRRSANIRYLRRSIAIAFARGGAHATGSGLIGLLFWWITH